MEVHERAKGLKGGGLRDSLPADRQQEGAADFMEEKVGHDGPDVTDDMALQQGQGGRVLTREVKGARGRSPWRSAAHDAGYRPSLGRGRTRERERDTPEMVIT